MPQRGQAYIIHNGKYYSIADKGILIIGRDVTNSHIVINDKKISRCHCKVTYNGERREFYIMDTSTNGTFLLGGKRARQGVSYTLRPGDEFYTFIPLYNFKVVIS